MSAKVEALLFDLGGVIVALDWERVFAHWARCSGRPIEQIRQAFTFDVPYQRQERGEIGAAAYYESLRRSLQLDIDDAEIEAGWKAVFVDTIPETVEMIRALRGRIPMHIFSNTNTAHHAEWAGRFAAVLEPFEKVFVSSQMALRKPSREAFEHVAREIGVAPGAILFFDDMLENVEGARAAGLQAVHVRSPQDVRDALRPWLPAT